MKIAVISDIHGNHDALSRVLADIDAVGARAVVSLGDNVGYGAEPEAVLAELASRNIPSVMGNHELGLADPTFCDWFNKASCKALEQTRSLLSPTSIDSFRSLPHALLFHGALCVHGCPPDSVEKYLIELEDDELVERMDRTSARLCFVGHTHLLEVRRIDGSTVTYPSLPEDDAPFRLDPAGRYVVNVGSVGQPRDGDLRAKYVLWDDELGEISVRRVAYDAEAAARKIIKAGLPEAYARRLVQP